jgi:hypothetical protein
MHWVYPEGVAERAYQVACIERALLNNTLVCLPTGLGKTLIAAVVMYNFYRWFPAVRAVCLPVFRFPCTRCRAARPAHCTVCLSVCLSNAVLQGQRVATGSSGESLSRACGRRETRHFQPDQLSQRCLPLAKTALESEGRFAACTRSSCRCLGQAA